MSSSKRRREMEKVLNRHGGRYVYKRPTEEELAEWNEAYSKREENIPKRPDFPDDESYFWAIKNFWDAQPPDYLYTTDESDGGMLPTPEESEGSPSPPSPRIFYPFRRSPPKPRPYSGPSWQLILSQGPATRTRAGIRKKKEMPWFWTMALEFHELDDKGMSRVVCDALCSDKVDKRTTQSRPSSPSLESTRSEVAEPLQEKPGTLNTPGRSREARPARGIKGGRITKKGRKSRLKS